MIKRICTYIIRFEDSEICIAVQILALVSWLEASLLAIVKADTKLDLRKRAATEVADVSGRRCGSGEERRRRGSVSYCYGDRRAGGKGISCASDCDSDSRLMIDFVNHPERNTNNKIHSQGKLRLRAGCRHHLGSLRVHSRFWWQRKQHRRRCLTG